MPSIGARCHESRIRGQNKTWRLIYRIDEDRVLIVEVFSKQTRQTPDIIIKACQKRLAAYDQAKKVDQA